MKGNEMLKEYEETTTRAEHLAWCKKRALAYLPGDPEQAFASMCSDLNVHEKTRGHLGMEFGMARMMGPGIPDMREFIEGFN